MKVLGKMSRNRRARVVFPDEEQPDMLITMAFLSSMMAWGLV